MNPLALIPLPYRLLIELGVVAAVLVGVFTAGHRGGVRADRVVMTAKLNELQAKWDKERADLQAAALAQSEKFRAQEAQRIAAASEQDREDQAHEERRAAAAVVVAAADQRMRDAFAATAARCGAAPGDSAAVAVSPAASSPADLLTFVQGRMGEAAQGVVGYADAAADAAESCAARYDSLRP